MFGTLERPKVEAAAAPAGAAEEPVKAAAGRATRSKVIKAQ